MAVYLFGYAIANVQRSVGKGLTGNEIYYYKYLWMPTL
jgi:hypothetical protein